MRTLIYVPIIHSVTDMGSLGEELKRKSALEFGEDRWQKHTETVNGYWDAIESYFENIDLYIKETKIYQDGMFVDGEIGMKLISDGVKAGSKNSIIVSNLLNRGAILIRTEDFQMVKAEYDGLQRILKAKSNFKKILLMLRYKLSKPLFLKRRDKFMAGRIAETLGPTETGILFIGAYHNVMNRLPKDITVIELKEIAKIKRYQKLIQYHSKTNALQFEQLSEYLIKR
jgi:hypothetical protein